MAISMWKRLRELLDTIDIETGQIKSTVSTSVSNFVADDVTGELVGVSGGKFGVIDPTTGSFTAVGSGDPNLQVEPPGTEAAANGYFDIKELNSTLYTISIKTGAITTSLSATTAPNFVAEQTSIPPKLQGATITVNGGTVTASIDPGQTVGLILLSPTLAALSPLSDPAGTWHCQHCHRRYNRHAGSCFWSEPGSAGTVRITTDPVTVGAGRQNIRFRQNHWR